MTSVARRAARPAARRRGRCKLLRGEHRRAGSTVSGVRPGSARTRPHARRRGTAYLQALAQDTIDFIDAVVGGPAHVVGHSVGAGVALHAALRRPDLIRRLVLISGAFHHDGLISTNEIDVDQVVAAFGASYGAVSPDGEDHYPVVVRKIFEMDQRDPALTPSDLTG